MTQAVHTGTSGQNRLLDSLMIFSEQEVEYKINNPLGSSNDLAMYNLKKKYLENLLKAYKSKLTKPEKDTRWFIKNELKKLKVRTNPSFINYLIRGKLARWFINSFFKKKAIVKRHLQEIKSYERDIARDRNSTLLSNQVKQAGFTQDIDHTIKKMVDQGLESFHIRYADMKNPNTDFVLHFRKLPGSDTYIFEQFEAAARPSWQQSLNRGALQWYTFPCNAQDRFLAQEAANLVNGRSLCKDQTGDSWIMLDRTAYANSIKVIPFDVEKALEELPLAKMNAIERKNIIRALKNGDMKEIPVKVNSQTFYYKAYANPQDQSLRLLDEKGKLVDIKQIENQKEYQAKIANKINDQSQTKVVNIKRGVS